MGNIFPNKEFSIFEIDTRNVTLIKIFNFNSVQKVLLTFAKYARSKRY